MFLNFGYHSQVNELLRFIEDKFTKIEGISILLGIDLFHICASTL